MDDLISRKNAIEELAKLCRYLDSEGRWQEGTGVGIAKELIEHMPGMVEQPAENGGSYGGEY